MRVNVYRQSIGWNGHYYRYLFFERNKEVRPLLPIFVLRKEQGSEVTYDVLYTIRQDKRRQTRQGQRRLEKTRLDITREDKIRLDRTRQHKTITRQSQDKARFIEMGLEIPQFGV